MIIDVPMQELPLCPNSYNPMHPLHQFHVQLQDAAYKSNATDENLEFETDELTKMYGSLSDDRFSGRMYLYRDGVTVYKHGVNRIESWYFRCYICGLILPAVAHQ